MGEVHKNDVSSYKRFLEKFCAVLEKRTDGEDDLPIRLAPSFIVESEVEGECLDWLLQYLSVNKCPSALSSPICRCVCDELLALDLSPLFEEGESFETEDSDLHAHSQVPQIEARRLAKLAFTKLYDVCDRWNKDMPEISKPEQLYEVYAHAIKNTRRKMEDRHVILHDINSIFSLKDYPSQSYFAVFDGHGGVEGAMYTASHLHCQMVHRPEFREDAEAAIRESYRQTDYKFIEKAQREGLRSGSTCVTALIRGKKLHLAWLGDSQAVLVRDGQVLDVMDPHKPEREDEKKRIEDLGGVVVWFGTWRVNGNIAVSRAIGDIEHKPYISCEPDVLTLDLDGTEDYLILGCDGVWDTLPKEELPEIMYTYLQECEGDRTMVAQRLVSIARDNGSTDNISVVIVFFKDQISEPKPASANIQEVGKSEVDAGKGAGDGMSKENPSTKEADTGESSQSNGKGNGVKTGSERKSSRSQAGQCRSSRSSRKDSNSNSTRKVQRKKGPKMRKKKVAEPTAVLTEPSKDVTRKSNKKSNAASGQNNAHNSSPSTKVHRSKRTSEKSDNKDKGVVWAFTGRSQALVQNHRLNQRASKPTLGLGTASSYLNKTWLQNTLNRIMDRKQKEFDRLVPADQTNLDNEPWYAQEMADKSVKSDDKEEKADTNLPEQTTLEGTKSMLYRNTRNSVSMPGKQMFQYK